LSHNVPVVSSDSVQPYPRLPKGEARRRLRQHDWSSTPIGPPETWPAALRTLVEVMLGSSEPMFVVWGPDRTLLYNEPYSEVLANKHPAIGRDFLEVWEEIRADLTPLVERAYAGEPTRMDDIPLLMMRKGYPERTHWTFSYTPIRVDDGRVGGFLCACHEITAQVRAGRQEAVLLDLERSLQAAATPAETYAAACAVLGPAMDGVLCSFALVDPSNEALDVVGEWHLGQVDTVLGRHRIADWGAGRIADLLSGAPESVEDVTTDPRTAGEGLASFEAIGARASLTVPHLRDGVVRAILSVGVSEPRRWAPDEIALAQRIAARCWQAAERARAEAELAESEARFRNMADQAPVMMWVTEPDGRCTYLNRAWYAFTGQSREEAEGFGWLDAVHPDDRGWSGDTFLAANAKGEAFRLEYRLRRADGAYRWAIDAASPRFGPGGEFLGYIGSVIDIDERHELETRLRENEERLRLATEHAEVGFWDVDEANGVLHWPPLVKAMFGISADVPVSMTDFYEGLHPDDRPGVANAYAAAADPVGRALYDVEYRTVGKEDGIVRWVAAKGRGLFAGDGPDARCLRVLGTAIDVTRRKQAEERLRELNETLQQRVDAALAERKLLADIVEGTDAFVQVVDRDFRWLAVNRAAADEFERIFGARPQVGLSMLDLLAPLPEQREAVRAVWTRALAGEQFTEIGEFGDPGRDRRQYEMKYNILRGPDGVQIGAYQFVYDVTERIREQERLATAEAARREADALYRAYFENTAEALFVVNVEADGGFTVEDLNPAHQASVGMPLAEVRGRRLDAILPAEQYARVAEPYRHVLRTGRVHQYRESFRLGPGGAETFWDTVLVPVRDETGRILRLIGSSRDLTRQLAAEQQLRQAQKMEAMGQLTGGVAHDFNNLLTPIVGALDLLHRKGLGGEREQRLIGGAIQSAERAKTLVQRLLAFARRQPIQPVAVDVAALVRGMAELVESTTGPQIRVVVEVEESVRAALADPNQVEMALLNLSVNARDAMPGGGTLRITAGMEPVRSGHRSALPAGDYVRLSVADTGVGMDEATAQRAIEPFFSTKGVGKGTGLGLSMVHGLALQLGGALTIQSRPGLGTNVELWLPVSDAAPDRANPAVGGEVVTRAAGCALLVDDEALVRASTADMLADLGYDVVEAETAEQALRQVGEGLRPDLLVTDHLMPGMNGTDLALTLRAERPDLPVLVVSGYAESDGLALDLPRLAKPFRREELAERLAQLAPDGGLAAAPNQR
jgi:PAS domain S-box-containing protein